MLSDSSSKRTYFFINNLQKIKIMLQKITLVGRDGGEKKVDSKGYLNIACSSKSSINYFGDNLPHGSDWYMQRAAMNNRIRSLVRQLDNARKAAVLLRDLVIAEELKDEQTYPKELQVAESETIDIIKEMDEVEEMSDSEDLELAL